MRTKRGGKKRTEKKRKMKIYLSKERKKVLLKEPKFS